MRCTFLTVLTASPRLVTAGTPGAMLAHISPVHSENVNFFGVIDVDVNVEGELAKLDDNGIRPLRGGTNDGTIL
jgi:hypothetical protein